MSAARVRRIARAASAIVNAAGDQRRAASNRAVSRRVTCSVTVAWDDPAMETRDESSECTVCWGDTAVRCSPCGDPVCHNCHCPNGCDRAVLGIADEWWRDAQTVIAA
jgi:hypothetical protein